MIKTVIFDADGVLINGERFAIVLARELKTDSVKEKEFFTGIFQECLVGNADLKESLKPYLTSFGWDRDVESFLEFWFKSEHSLNEDLMNYVDRLRSNSVLTVLATNQEKYRTEYMLKHMGFDGKFDSIYSSAHIGVKKPAEEFYAKVIDDLGLVKDEVLFWDDEERNIQGALKYGIHAELYKGFNNFIITMEEKYKLEYFKG